MSAMPTGSCPHAWSISSSALTPNMAYRVSSWFMDIRATSPMVYMPRSAKRRAMPEPMRQKSVMGVCAHSSRLYAVSSSAATRTPSASGVMRLATMSMAILHRYILVPIPAVAVTPVSRNTWRIMVIAIACGSPP